MDACYLFRVRNRFALYPNQLPTEFYDPEHSEREDRFILLGVSSAARTLVVVHCYRETDSVVRIISARKATRKEVRL